MHSCESATHLSCYWFGLNCNCKLLGTIAHDFIYQGCNNGWWDRVKLLSSNLACCFECISSWIRWIVMSPGGQGTSERERKKKSNSYEWMIRWMCISLSFFFLYWWVCGIHSCIECTSWSSSILAPCLLLQRDRVRDLLRGHTEGTFMTFVSRSKL